MGLPMADVLVFLVLVAMAGLLLVLALAAVAVLLGGRWRLRQRLVRLEAQVGRLDVRLAELVLQLQSLDERLDGLQRLPSHGAGAIAAEQPAEDLPKPPEPAPASPPAPEPQPPEAQNTQQPSQAEQPLPPRGLRPPGATPAGIPAPPRPPAPTKAPQPVAAQARATPPETASPQANRPQPRPRSRQLWQRMERLVSENWTGILGVVVVVAGVTFAAINVALRLDAFQRFLLTLLAAAALSLPSPLIGRREPWRNLSDWMRSGGAALALFACTAAGGLPQLGLQWIHSPGPALALVSLGVALNLALAGIARTEAIASLHVVVNLVPLLIVPQTGLTLAIASAVALVGYGLPLRRRWNRHLLLVTWAYAAYHASWFVRCQELLEDGGQLRTGAALAAVLVFGGGAVLQHRVRALQPRLEALPLALQLSNWGALGLALLVYPQQAAARATALALAAAAVLLLGLRARRNGQGWLHLSDVLVAQALALAALLSLQPLIANTPLLLGTLQLECLLFLGLGVLEGEATIRRIGWWLTLLTGSALALAGLVEAVQELGSAVQLQNSAVLLAAAGLGSASQWLLRRRGVALPLPPLLGWVIATQVWVGTCLTAPEAWRPSLTLVAMGGLLLVARRHQLPGLMAGLATAVGLAHLQGWFWILEHQPWQAAGLLHHLLPLLVLALLLLWNRQDPWPRRCGWVLVQGSGAVLILGSAVQALLAVEGDRLGVHVAVLLAGAGFAALLQVLLERRAMPQPWPPLLGWMAAGLATSGAMLVPQQNWRDPVALLALGALLGLARWLRPAGLLAGSATAVLLLHGWRWLNLLLGHPWAAEPLLARLLPLVGLALALIWAARSSSLRRLGIDLLGLNAGLGAFLLFDPLSPLIPGVAWLVLALIALEGANRLPRAEALHALGLGLGYLTAFSGSYLLVISQSPAYISLGPLSLRGRLLIELFAIAVILYWWFFHAGSRLAQLRLWRSVQPCLLEAALLGVGLTILGEITVLWRPVAWSLLALVLLSTPLRRLFAQRLQVYSVLFYWLSVATLVAMLSALESPAAQWYGQPQQIGLVAIGLQLAYIVASHHWLDLEQLRQPGGLAPLAWIGQRVANRRNRWLYYPMFAAVAYYLALRYDRSLLTLLWAAEAFIIYVLSAVLREGQFRLVALLGLGGCLLRLLAIDMAQADLGLRGLVFIGVGLLMLAMNAIYNRYRSRFE
ncbi:hypothetical protein [Vulcanococcus limneticus]|uniref:hypothetical protein n=1 Tax=Vulcanococcus limneticus TaxID=2170428 RepID=UPI00398C07D9